MTDPTNPTLVERPQAISGTAEPPSDPLYEHYAAACAALKEQQATIERLERELAEAKEIRSHGYIIRLDGWRTKLSGAQTVEECRAVWEQLILKLDQVAIDYEGFRVRAKKAEAELAERTKELERIAGMCGIPDPVNACRLICKFAQEIITRHRAAQEKK